MHQHFYWHKIQIQHSHSSQPYEATILHWIFLHKLVIQWSTGQDTLGKFWQGHCVHIIYLLITGRDVPVVPALGHYNLVHESVGKHDPGIITPCTSQIHTIPAPLILHLTNTNPCNMSPHPSQMLPNNCEKTWWNLNGRISVCVTNLVFFYTQVLGLLQASLEFWWTKKARVSARW